MKKLASIAVGWLMAFLLLGISPLWAQEEAGNYFTITGIVKNKDNKRKLENVNVSVPGTNIGTVTNADGVFSLKIKDTETILGLEVSHIGYLNSQVSLKDKEDVSDLTIWMLPAPNLLSEIVVFGNNARGLVEEAIKKIPVNETFADVAEITGDKKYLELARRFSHKVILDPSSIRKPVLNSAIASRGSNPFTSFSPDGRTAEA